MNKHPERGMKLAALAAAALGLLAAFVLLPLLASALLEEYPAYQKWYWPGLIYGWVVLLPGFAGLWEFWKVCVQIGRDNSFSQENARSLFRICLLALTMAALLVVGMAALCLLGMGLPALLIAMLGFAAACALVALLANALSQLVRRAAAIKSENDLTISEARHGYHRQFGRHARQAQDAPDGAFREGGHHHGQPLHSQDRQGARGALFHAGRHLQGPELPAGRHP